MEIAAEVWSWVGPKATGTARFGGEPRRHGACMTKHGACIKGSYPPTSPAATRTSSPEVMGGQLDAGHAEVGVLSWDFETEAVAAKLRDLGGTPETQEVAKLTARTSSALPDQARAS